MKPFRLIAALSLACAAPALANDSTAELTAGGLVLRQSEHIDMLEEDLYLSADEIRVNYVFRNASDRDVTTIVAFPLPELDLSYDGDWSYSHDFETRVEGEPVPMSVETRAFVGGRDVTDLLTARNIVLMPGEDWNAYNASLEGMSAEDAAALEAQGVIDVSRWEDNGTSHRYVRPIWTVRQSYYWEQTFPAGEELRIAHRYAPSVGGTAGSALAYSGFRESEWGQEMIAEYCMDEDFLVGAQNMLGRSEYGGLSESTFGYVLTTGANWRSPIGRFRLVVDKGSTDAIVSFCGSGLRRIAPTQFEMVRENFRPERDLRVILLAPLG